LAPLTLEAILKIKRKAGCALFGILAFIAWLKASHAGVLNQKSPGLACQTLKLIEAS
jgi:hypothetical protein